jgi:hypothetical protein
MQHEKQLRLEQMTVDVILAMRNEYLRNGASPLKAWDQIQDRLRSATRQSAGVKDWVTNLGRALNLPSPSKARCLAIDRLSTEVDDKTAQEWLDMVEAQHSFLIAKTMLLAEQRKHEREAEWNQRMNESIENQIVEEDLWNSAG